MAERYSFSGDKPLISIDNSGVWSPDTSALNDTINEGYVTADETTQYLSALEDDETNEISLDNLNLTLTDHQQLKNEIIDESDGSNFLTQTIEQNEEIGTNQVVVYTMEGSEELYGIQLAQDEEGNIQKYQFQFRKNEDGQLEAIPETIQLLPMNEDEVQLDDGNNEYINISEAGGNEMQIFVQEENAEDHILPDNDLSNEQYEDESTMMFEEETEDIVDIKPNVQLIDQVQIKEEHHNEEYIKTNNLIDQEIDVVEYNPHDQHPENEHDQEFATTLAEAEGVDEEEGEVVNQDDFHEFDQECFEESISQQSEPETIQTDIDQVLEQGMTVLQENGEISHHLSVDNNDEDEESISENERNDSENEYQVIEGLHITGDVEAQQSQDLKIAIPKTNILKKMLKNNLEVAVKKDNRFFLYFVHSEKENVDSLTLNNPDIYKTVRTNPRSVLKSSYLTTHPKVEVTVNDYNERISRRFARNKEAIQARILHDFINKTTIPQAPVRKDRLPRKQQIKPVERQDEEIVVQEMMISSHGFVESTGSEARKSLEITEYVELSDSDDEFDPKTSGKMKKKKNRKPKQSTEITISDSDSEHSVIEVDLTDDGGTSQEIQKRRRGRPSKSDTIIESPLKKLCLDENITTKSEIPCTKCSKAFPSQNSLRTHLQHHNLQNNFKKSPPPQQATNHVCKKCDTQFKNRILLSRHNCSAFICAVCKKKCADLSSLTIHKRSHAKQQLCKSTTVEQVSPKKIKPPVFKSPKKATNLKCKHCSKLCSSLSVLNIHMKTHKEFICTSCSASFPSKILLDLHLRCKCVKSPKSYKQSFNRITRRSSRIEGADSDKAITENLNRTSRFSTSVIPKVSCDNCSLQFNTHKALFKHKVVKHGFDTPDKSSIEEGNKKKLHKERGAHGGIPAKQSLKNLYSEFQSKLNEF